MTKALFLHSSLRFLNLPYYWGGDDPMRGYDCSGLVQDLLAQLGLQPPHDMTSQQIHNYFLDPNRGLIDHFDTGTLTFYGKSKTQINHVGMILLGKTMIEAAGGNSTTVTLERAIAQNAFVRLRPYDRRKDLVAIIHPRGFPWSAKLST